MSIGLCLLAAVAVTLSGCESENGTVQAANGGSVKTVTSRAAAKVETGNTPSKPRAVANSNKLQSISFDDLEFEIERDQDFERSMLTPEIEALHGSRVKIYGFFLGASVFQQTGIEKFVLIRDNQECCFGPGAYIYHNMQVEMEEGKGADFSVRPVAVEGELHIQPWFGPDGKCYSVFHLTASKVSE